MGYVSISTISFALNNDVDIDTILKTDDNSKVGYIVECDLEFPIEIHDKLKEFPPCPETLAPTNEMLSKYQHSLVEKDNIKVGGCSKLIPHLMKHERYIVFIIEILSLLKNMALKLLRFIM